MPRSKRPISNPSKIMRELMEIYDATGMTQAELAHRAGISQSTLSQIRGNNRAYSTVLIAEWVGEALGYHLEWIKNEQPAKQSTSAHNPGPGHYSGVDNHKTKPDD
jgi:DNA-binding XRE family transcriptional regulator